MTNVTKGGEYFECVGCGNVVEVKRMGGGELLCCGQAMKAVNYQSTNPTAMNNNVVQH